MPNLPAFRYHLDPISSGSVVASDAQCLCCGQQRGFAYVGPVYAEANLDGLLCPWCIADGTAHERFDATFVDSEAFGDGVGDEVIDEVTQRTPGYASWQGEGWPTCCGDAAAFVRPAGITDIRLNFRHHEGPLLSHIVHNMGISGGAATRLLISLDVTSGPTAYLFRCLTCEAPHFHIDQP
jgi:uncharacterized protein